MITHCLTQYKISVTVVVEIVYKV